MPQGEDSLTDWMDGTEVQKQLSAVTQTLKDFFISDESASDPGQHENTGLLALTFGRND